MLEKELLLDTFDKVRSFVDIANSKDYDIELISGKYVANGKSIMGVFGLNLTKPVVMVAHCTTQAELMKQIKPFINEK